MAGCERPRQLASRRAAEQAAASACSNNSTRAIHEPDPQKTGCRQSDLNPELEAMLAGALRKPGKAEPQLPSLKPSRPSR
jgi:hypothetical protein